MHGSFTDVWQTLRCPADLDFVLNPDLRAHPDHSDHQLCMLKVRPTVTCLTVYQLDITLLLLQGPIASPFAHSFLSHYSLPCCAIPVLCNGPLMRTEPVRGLRLSIYQARQATRGDNGVVRPHQYEWRISYTKSLVLLQQAVCSLDRALYCHHQTAPICKFPVTHFQAWSLDRAESRSHRRANTTCSI